MSGVLWGLLAISVSPLLFIDEYTSEDAGNAMCLVSLGASIAFLVIAWGPQI